MTKFAKKQSKDRTRGYQTKYRVPVMDGIVNVLKADGGWLHAKDIYSRMGVQGARAKDTHNNFYSMKECVNRNYIVKRGDGPFYRISPQTKVDRRLSRAVDSISTLREKSMKKIREAFGGANEGRQDITKQEVAVALGYTNTTSEIFSSAWNELMTVRLRGGPGPKSNDVLGRIVATPNVRGRYHWVGPL